MRTSELLERLKSEVLIGDGAFGTMISERGIGRDVSYEGLNLTHPELVREIHGAYLDAGADLIETNTFGANRSKLAVFRAEDEVSAINRAGVALAQESVRSAARQGGCPPALVAGSVGPLALAGGGARTSRVDGRRHSRDLSRADRRARGRRRRFAHPRNLQRPETAPAGTGDGKAAC